MTDVLKHTSSIETELQEMFQKIYHANVSVMVWEVQENKLFHIVSRNWKTEIILNKHRLSEEKKPLYFMQVAWALEMSEGRAQLHIRGGLDTIVESLEQSKNNSAIQFFYNFIFQHIVLWKPNIPPTYIARMQEYLQGNLKKLAKKYDTIPKHIQLLLGITGVKPQDIEVDEAIKELQSANIIWNISDPRVDIVEKVKNIHDQILSLYEYFLGYDKAKRPQKKSKIVQEIEQKIENINQEDTSQWQEADNSDDSNSLTHDEQLPEEHTEDTPTKTLEDIIQDLFPDMEMEDASGESGLSGWGNWAGWSWKWAESGWNEESQENQEEQAAPNYQPEYNPGNTGKLEKVKSGGFRILIEPNLEGYYANDYKGKFNSQTLSWTSTSKASTFANIPQLTGRKQTMRLLVNPGNVTALPLIKTYAFDPASLKLLEWWNAKIFRSKGWIFSIQATSKTHIEIDFYKEVHTNEESPTPEDMESISVQGISKNAQKATDDAKQEKDIKQKIRIIRAYVRQNHSYPTGKWEEATLKNAQDVQQTLRRVSNGGNYIKNIDASPYIECYSANTLLIALLRALGIPAKLATWYHPQSPNRNGETELTASNWHAWAMVWIGNEWQRYDATPEKEDDEEWEENKQDEQTADGKSKKDSGTPNHADDGWDDSDDSASRKKKEDKKWGESQWTDKKDGWKKKWNKTEASSSQEGGGDWGDDSDDDSSSDSEKSGKVKQKSQWRNSEKWWEEHGGDDTIPEWEENGEDIDPESEFQRMYDELDDTGVWLPDEETLEDMIEQIRERSQEIQEDNVERQMREKYPELGEEGIQELSKFIRAFRKDLDVISRIKNPGYEKWLSPNATLQEELKAILDRVISRRLVSYEKPRYPVADGYNLRLVNPVQLQHDWDAWVAESHAFMTLETAEHEEVKIVKVRRRKILDASGSMDEGTKLRTQQQIEVLDNMVTAQKQIELDEISTRLQKDLWLETETWQFWAWSAGFRILKPMSSTFSEIEQSAVWSFAASAIGGTNDYDPLEAIYEILIQEERVVMQSDSIPDEWTPLERIRIWYLVREVNAWKNLWASEIEDKSDKIHFENLDTQDPSILFQAITRILWANQFTSAEIKFIQNSKNHTPSWFQTWASSFIKTKPLSQEEKIFFQNLDITRKKLAEIYEEWIQVMKERNKNIEPILEVVEISSDGWSNSPTRTHAIVEKLRSLWVIVVAYGLGPDGWAVESVYINPYNPKEGGVFCQNLLDYPRKKSSTWHNILDSI
jgi:hypothetical protein